MSYLDKYPFCIGCPVQSYCGKAISSVVLCNSDNNQLKNKKHVNDN